MAEQWKLREAGNVQMRRGCDLLPDDAGADQAGQADAEDGERKPGRNLIDREPQCHDGEEQGHQDACNDAAERADRDRAGQERAAEAADGAHDHHAFDAEIEHARTLGDELAGRGDQQWRRC